jgi:hypothetical protein
MSNGDEFVRVERVLAWAAVQTASAHRRCTLVARVRRFALAMHAENPRHEVPPRACVGHAKMVRRPPHIYTADEIDRIMHTAGHMPAKGRSYNPSKCYTCRLMFGPEKGFLTVAFSRVYNGRHSHRS